MTKISKYFANAKKYLVFTVIIMLIGTCIIPSISGNIRTINGNISESNNSKESIQSDKTEKTVLINTSDTSVFNRSIEPDNSFNRQDQRISIDKKNKNEMLQSDETVKTVPIRGYNDVYFNSSFEMGNLINVQYKNGNATGHRYYTAEINYSTNNFSDKHWWFHFSMENTTGKTITIELQNLAPEDFGTGDGLPRWQSMEPVYSYDDKDGFREIIQFVMVLSHE